VRERERKTGGKREREREKERERERERKRERERERERRRRERSVRVTECMRVYAWVQLRVCGGAGASLRCVRVLCRARMDCGCM